METRRKRKKFSIIRSKTELKSVMPGLPDESVYKFISTGGFSSISFILLVAERARINTLYASTFRIGKKELQLLDALHKQEKLGSCCFAVGALMANDSDSVKRYKYYENFVGVCEKNGWKYRAINNHSKILLFDTDIGKFVLETSSNLNENPKIEQFSFEKDAELFEFYKAAFEEWGVADG